MFPMADALFSESNAGPAGAAGTPYLVLARKYRPLSFSTLIGQDAMVQTLRNAFKAGRIPHAFILTGIRGVGKTTTARILARAVNYEDGSGRRPNLDLDSEGIHCRAIIEGRHVDVVEMDAASNTGINDVREIIDSVKYGPVSAPYKVYIIDEVHMLSTQAFNGLLKTLEEPPPYVKFIFATTEIRKVPVTILSRCMRFDLRRVSPETMTAHLVDILRREGIDYEPEALAMIVRAGEGSVRDNQSLLDQAISYGDGKVTAASVKAMLGLGDRARTIDLFEHLMRGDVAAALTLTRDLYDAGADPQTLIADLCDFTHLVTRLKIVPAAVEDMSLTPDERTRGAEFAQKLAMRVLTRTWQILFKGFDEVAQAGDALQAAEMVLVRLAYAADLPTPDELAARVGGDASAASVATRPVARGGGGAPAAQSLRAELPAARLAAAPAAAPASSAVPRSEPTAFANPQSYEQLVALAGEKRDLIVQHALKASLRPIAFADGRIEVALVEGADPGIIQTLSARLKLWTGRSWMISVGTTTELVPTVRELETKRQEAELRAAHEDPLVQAIMETFPGARVANVRVKDEGTGALPDLPPVEAYEDEDDE